MSKGIKIRKSVKINYDEILTIYLGKAGRCMCGCSGNYKYVSKYKKFAGKNRGYDLSPDEISDRAVRSRFNKFNSIEDKVEVIDNRIFTKYYGQDRQLTIYLKKGYNNEED